MTQAPARVPAEGTVVTAQLRPQLDEAARRAGLEVPL